MLHQTAIGIALVIAVALPATATADLTPADARKSLSEVALTNSKGEPVNLSAYKGRVVLLDFWATWCTGCKKESPGL